MSLILEEYRRLIGSDPSYRNAKQLADNGKPWQAPDDEKTAASLEMQIDTIRLNTFNKFFYVASNAEIGPFLDLRKWDGFADNGSWQNRTPLPGTQPVEMINPIAFFYSKYLNRAPDMGGLKFWTEHYADVSLNELEKSFIRAAAENGEITEAQAESFLSDL